MFKAMENKLQNICKNSNNVLLTSLGSCFPLDFAVVIPYSLTSFSILLRTCFVFKDFIYYLRETEIVPESTSREEKQQQAPH